MSTGITKNTPLGPGMTPSPAFPKSNPITQPANPGSATPGGASGTPTPANPGSRGGGSVARPVRPAAKTPTGPAGPR